MTLFDLLNEVKDGKKLITIKLSFTDKKTDLKASSPPVVFEAGVLEFQLQLHVSTNRKVISQPTSLLVHNQSSFEKISSFSVEMAQPSKSLPEVKRSLLLNIVMKFTLLMLFFLQGTCQ